MNHAELKGHERVFLVRHGDVAVLRIVARGSGPRRVSERSVRIDHLPYHFFATARAKARNEQAAYPAAAAIVEAVEASNGMFAISLDYCVFCTAFRGEHSGRTQSAD